MEPTPPLGGTSSRGSNGIFLATLALKSVEMCPCSCPWGSPRNVELLHSELYRASSPRLCSLNSEAKCLSLSLYHSLSLYNSIILYPWTHQVDTPKISQSNKLAPHFSHAVGSPPSRRKARRTRLHCQPWPRRWGCGWACCNGGGGSKFLVRMVRFFIML